MIDGELEELRTYRGKPREVSIGGDEFVHTVLETRSNDLRVECEIAANLRGLANAAKRARVGLTRHQQATRGTFHQAINEIQRGAQSAVRKSLGGVNTRKWVTTRTNSVMQKTGRPHGLSPSASALSLRSA